MADVCPRCLRHLADDVDYDHAEWAEESHGRESAEYAPFLAMCWARFGDCTGDEVTPAEAYRRGLRDGIDEGVRIAKREAYSDDIIYWDAVDAAAERAKGE